MPAVKSSFDPDHWEIVQFGSSLPSEIIHKKTRIKLVAIPAGSFMRGDIQGDWAEDALPHLKAQDPGVGNWISNRDSEGVKVKVAPFYLSESVLKRNQCKKLLGKDPSWGSVGPDSPVDHISYLYAEEHVLKKLGCRFPTEDEWEYACRGGTNTRMLGANSMDDISWHYGNSDKIVHAVKTKIPNGYGLYDMLGNQWEWCLKDKEATTSVLRGGSFLVDSPDLRVSLRRQLPVASEKRDVGLRIALTFTARDLYFTSQGRIAHE
jgi:formylglycine-generating enzyme required for sulfatase activity